MTTLLPVKSLPMAERSSGAEGTLHMTYTMMQVCRELGMTYQTLKFYCNQGLVPYIKRDKNNRRVFDERDVEWIRSLTCLKRCGMSIEEMRDYLNLYLEGEKSIPQRKKMLAEKRASRRADGADPGEHGLHRLEAGLLRRHTRG